MAFDPAKPNISQATMAEVLASARENARAIARREMPLTQISIDGLSSVTIPSTAYLVEFLGYSSISTVTIEPVTTDPAVIEIWCFSANGMRFAQGGNLWGFHVPAIIRPNTPFLLTYLREYGQVMISTMEEGYSTFADLWMQKKWIQQNGASGVNYFGFTSTAAGSGTPTAQVTNGRQCTRFAQVTNGQPFGVASATFAQFGISRTWRVGGVCIPDQNAGDPFRLWMGLSSSDLYNVDTPGAGVYAAALRYSKPAADTSWKLYLVNNGASTVYDLAHPLMGQAGAGELIWLMDFNPPWLSVHMNGEWIKVVQVPAWPASSADVGLLCKGQQTAAGAAYLDFCTMWAENT